MSDSIVDLLAADSLEDGDVVAVQVDGGPKLAVYRVEGEYFVTDDRCTHAEASLSEGWLEGYCIECPIHAGQFDVRTGEALSFPVTVDIKAWRTWVDSGRVKVDLGQPITRGDAQ